eukprot:jgi/Tetstr1/463108/TSEL_008042.t1
MNKKIGITLLVLVVLGAFTVNKVYENHHHSDSPFVLEVDEAELVMVSAGEGTTRRAGARPVELPADPLQRGANRLLGRLQDSFQPWGAQQPKVIAKRAIIYAKSMTDTSEPAPTTRKLLGR